MTTSRYEWLFAVLLFVGTMALLFASSAHGQTVMNPPTGVHKLFWNHDGLNTDHYEIRVAESAPWIPIGKPSPLQATFPELSVGSYLADVRACNAAIPPVCTQSDKALPFSVIAPTLPVLWANTDIGDVGQLGSSSWAGNVFTVTGDGLDIWTAADAFQFVYQPLGTNTEIVARVTAAANVNTYAKAGVMMRSDLTPLSQHAMMNVIPDGTVEFISRATAGAQSTAVWIGLQPKPLWLKLTRTGNTVIGSFSKDGTAWTVGGSADVQGVAYVGLAVTSHDASLLNASTFDQVAVTDLVPAPAAPTDPVTR